MPFLQQALVFLAATVVAVPIATRLGLGSVLGYLAAGVAIGPAGLGLAGDPGEVLHVAELGVVLFLFLVGLELDPQRLLRLRRAVFVAGGAQVAASAAALAALAAAWGWSWQAALVTGLGLSLSSTALGVQLLSERRELATPHGQTAFGVLLFQDLAAIPMLAVVPVLGARGADAGETPAAVVALGAALAIAAVALAGRYVARPALRAVGSLRNTELFTATALLLVAGTAALVSLAGLSMALGAFLAGVLLATSEYRHELEADLAPFKGLLLGLFFVGIGMAADVGLLGRRPGAIVLGVVALLAVKGAVGWAVGRRAGPDSAASLAIVLSQGGEFGFVLFGLAADRGVLPADAAQALVLVVALSMATTPALLALHARVLRPRLAARAPREYDVAPVGEPPVIIAGFGRVGQVVGRLLRAKRIPFTALDASSEHIEFIRRFGNKVFYGDASRLDLLRAARADAARVFVLAIDDVEASMRTAELVLQHFPHLTIFARARNRQHAYRLRKLGIERITRETFRSSIDLSAEVLHALGVPLDDAVAAGQRLRAQDEALFEESWRHEGDLEKLTDIANRGREELERLFEQDEQERRAG
jgi:monovalent cation:proton antiporter-2 (CPA2) family protein